jgi:predicted nuclease of predicted toxin-antitoxin system
MKLVVDVNLSPEWVPLFRELGYEAVHWSEIGARRRTVATSQPPATVAAIRVRTPASSRGEIRSPRPVPAG